MAGRACAALGRDQEAIAHYALALAQHGSDERHGALWHLRSVSLLRLGRAVEAYAHAERACALSARARGLRLAATRGRHGRRADWHFNMVNDEPRNAAFARAIAHMVKPGQRVLEIGTGSGLLAMLAARDEQGAPRAAQVITCEANPLLSRLATQIIHEMASATACR